MFTLLSFASLVLWSHVQPSSKVYGARYMQPDLVWASGHLFHVQLRKSLRDWHRKSKFRLCYLNSGGTGCGWTKQLTRIFFSLQHGPLHLWWGLCTHQMCKEQYARTWLTWWSVQWFDNCRHCRRGSILDEKARNTNFFFYLRKEEMQTGTNYECCAMLVFTPTFVQRHGQSRVSKHFMLRKLASNSHPVRERLLVCKIGKTLVAFTHEVHALASIECSYR